MQAIFLTLLMCAAPPKVTIESPAGGYSTKRVVVLKGQVSDQALTHAVVSVNGVDFKMHVKNGRFAQNLVLSRGANTLLVQAENSHGRGSQAVNVFSNIPAQDLAVYLIFEPQPFYVDLWVTEPDGTKCYWQRRTTKNGGKLHDLYNNLSGGGVGKGPQVYAISQAPLGTYTVEVNYWAGNKAKDIVPVKVVVVQYEGTEREQRSTSQLELFKPNDTVLISKFKVTQAVESGTQK